MWDSAEQAAGWLAVLLAVVVTGAGEPPPPAGTSGGVSGAGAGAGTGLEPTFVAPLENHTVTQGRDVHFTCSVNHLDNYRVAWIKSDSKAILAIHMTMVALNPRLSVTYNNHNTWRLHVTNVQANDSGTYMCQVNTDPMKSQMGQLSVVIPPDIVDGGGEEAVAREGGSVRLSCVATGVPPPSVVWKRDRGRHIIFRHDLAREKKAVSNYSGEVLLLAGVQRADMGSYYCIASNGVPPTVSRRYRVHVHFFPSIKVSNQLVGAPLGSDVVLQCYVEASPKAMNSWYRDNGDKLLESSKYHVTESAVSEYALWMNLTIRQLERRDYGGYVCASANALGKVEGSVSLHELELGAVGGGGGEGSVWSVARSTAWPRSPERRPAPGSHALAPEVTRAAATPVAPVSLSSLPVYCFLIVIASFSQFSGAH